MVVGPSGLPARPAPLAADAAKIGTGAAIVSLAGGKLAAIILSCTGHRIALSGNRQVNTLLLRIILTRGHDSRFHLVQRRALGHRVCIGCQSDSLGGPSEKGTISPTKLDPEVFLCL